MLKIIEQFFKSFGELFPDLKIRRYVLIIIFIALPLLVWFIDSQTNLIFFWYLQKKVEILKELCGINKDLALNSSQFSEAYNKIFIELESHAYFSITERISKIITTITIFTENLLSSQSFWKFFWGSFVGFGLTIFLGIQFILGDKSITRTTLFGSIMFGLIFGGIGFFVPTLYFSLINYIIYPVLQLMILVYFSQKTQTDNQNVLNEDSTQQADGRPV
jgi:hypothetical protein